MEDTIFNFIDSVLFSKKKLNTVHEGETQFNLYMVNRWCSMHSPDIAQIINETSNRYFKAFPLKQEQYEFLYNILPKRRKKRIEYIKKVKDKNEEKESEIPLIANAMEISKREVENYVKTLEIFERIENEID